MKPWSRIWAKSVSSGFQNPFVLSIRIGLVWRPSCAQVICSTSSSRVPMPPGQGHEGVGFLEHQALARVHVGNDDGLLHVVQQLLAGFQEVGDDARHIAAMVENGLGDGAHQADIAAAIDQIDAALGHLAAQCRRSFGENGIVAEAGAAIDTNGLDF